jgi:hypothetical protein
MKIRTNFLKYLLLPISMFLWYVLVFYSIFFSFYLMIWMLELSWIWIIIGSTFLLGIIGSISHSIPSLLRYLILKFYGLNWIIVILHTLAGALALFETFYSIFNKTYFISKTSDVSLPIMTILWKEYPIKVIVLGFPFLSLLIMFLYSVLITPILFKLDENEV